MSLLALEEHNALDISNGGAVLTYAHTSQTTRVSLCRITLGSNAEPIAGGATYTVQVYINDKRIQPDSPVAVLAGLGVVVVQSHELLIAEGDEVRIVVDGPVADGAVTTVAELIDMTPITRAEMLGGGMIAVDHNYGGTDALSYWTSQGVGVERATVQAFLKSDYDAGRRSALYIQGTTTTIAHGHWLSPLMLDPGTYTLLYFRQGVYGPNTRVVTVA